MGCLYKQQGIKRSGKRKKEEVTIFFFFVFGMSHDFSSHFWIRMKGAQEWLRRQASFFLFFFIALSFFVPTEPAPLQLSADLLALNMPACSAI